MTPVAENNFKPGLEGVIAAETLLSRVDGQKGELIIGGYTLEAIASQASFEEVVFLLWHGHRPTEDERETFTNQLAEKRHLPKATIELLKAIAKQRKPMMDALRIAAGTVDLDQQAKDHMHSAQKAGRKVFGGEGS